MSKIAEYLMKNYYAKYKGNRTDIVPSVDVLERGLANYPEKVIVIEDDEIRGVAIYLTLSDETMERLQMMDITHVETLVELLKEQGVNVHFVLLAADCSRTIMMGIKEIKNRLHPKTISWFDPELKHLHVFKIRS